MVDQRSYKLVSLREAARIIGVHHSTLSRAAKRGQLKSVGTTPGGWPRYRIADIESLRLSGVTGDPPRKLRSAVAGRAPLTGNSENALAALPDLARRLVGADYAAVTVLDGSGRVVRMYYSGIGPEDAARIGSPPTGKGVLGQLGPQDSPLRLDRIADHPSSAGFPAHHPPMQALLGVKVGGLTTRANLYVANATGNRTFTADDETLIRELAEYARLAITNEEMLARESEHRRNAELAGQRLSAVVRSIPSGAIIWDIQGKVAFANDEARRLCGLPLATGTMRAEIQATMKMFASDGRLIPVGEWPGEVAIGSHLVVGPNEISISRPDGSMTAVLASAAPVVDSQGRAVSAVVLFQDLSQIKELDRVKQDFFSMVTHDLRSPLATAKGIVGAARTEVEPGSHAASQWNEIDEELDFLTDLVSNLLDMARIEAGVNIFEYETCHMTDLVADAVRRTSRSRLAVGREVRVEVPSALPPVFADPAQIGRVLDNLLSNALKYSTGPVWVRSSSDAGQVLTEIVDVGQGIPVRHLDDLFSKFFRVRQSARRGREGAGLGLAICKAIVETHNGLIGVRSKQDEGSTFWFALPVENRPTPV